MELLPENIKAHLPPLYAQEHEEDPMVYVKFFHPTSHWTWYATEYDPQQRLFFGWVYGDYPELGYFSLDELEAVKDPLGMGIERDLHFTPTRLSEVQKLHPPTLSSCLMMTKERRNTTEISETASTLFSR